MKGQHVDPEEAVKVHQDVRSHKSIGIHWGTFDLACEVCFVLINMLALLTWQLYILCKCMRLKTIKIMFVYIFCNLADFWAARKAGWVCRSRGFEAWWVCNCSARQSALHTGFKFGTGRNRPVSESVVIHAVNQEQVLSANPSIEWLSCDKV